MKILALNAGSSSQKSRLYALDEPPGLSALPPVWEAQIDWDQGAKSASLRVRTSAGATVEREVAPDRRSALGAMIETLWSGPTRMIDGPGDVEAVGHRIVHGGPAYQESARITPQVTAAIEQYSEIAPDHNPAALAGIAVATHVLGAEVPQIAAFDTAFHAHMPLAAAVYPGPFAWYEQGIRRFGFHGISHQYCAERAAQLLGRDLHALRLVTCHLGNGCSLAAIRDGRSIDTTMGFTPMEGLMMGSRSGSVDPGILTYLLRRPAPDHVTAEDLDRILNLESGLKGISGVSGDMRAVLEARAKGNPRATLAYDMFIHRLHSSIGAMAAVLGGVDAIIFAGGIGEHAPEVRAGACDPLGHLGVKLDAARNSTRHPDALISSDDSPVAVLAIETQEDWMVARDCWRLLHSPGA